MSKTDLKKKGVELPEELVIKIITRLPPKSIFRFKLVCRDWKLLMESSFFIDIYSKSNWSILHGSYRCTTSFLEEVELNLHGKTRNWSFTSDVIRKYTQNNVKIKEIWVVACADGLVLLCVLEEDMTKRYYIGNPMLSQWIQLSSPPYLAQYHSFVDSGLVIRKHNSAILGYKVIRIYSEDMTSIIRTWSWTFQIYSSDTGEWSVQHVSCPGLYELPYSKCNPVSLNGKLHWFDDMYSRRIIVHDFFSYDDKIRELPLPVLMKSTQHESSHNKIICTTSQGCFVLIEAELIEEVKSYNVRVWRLESDSWNWEKAWEINMACVELGVKCVPMAINYFDMDIIYLWDLDHKCYIACNLRTHTKTYGTRRHGAPCKEDSLCLDSY
ncbi:hypothetical protein CARUB_v10002858mg, partial [Capsella rubella]